MRKYLGPLVSIPIDPTGSFTARKAYIDYLCVAVPCPCGVPSNHFHQVMHSEANSLYYAEVLGSA